MEAMRNSACAALEAVDYMDNFDEGKEEEEEEYTPRGRPPFGAHDTPFVSRRGGRNERWNKRRREEVNAFNEDEELREKDVDAE